MRSKTAFALILLAFSSLLMLGALFTPPVAGAPGPIEVNPGESIQAAIDAAGVGETVSVASGTYHEHLVINKSLTLKGAGSDTTFIDGDGIEGKPIVAITASNVEIKGFTIENGSASGAEPQGGIQIRYSVNVTCRDNVIRKSYYGIFLESASNSCDIINNTITDNYACGIKISVGSFNLIVGNNITNNPTGIYITSTASKNNSLYRNNIINNPTQLNNIGEATEGDNGAEGNYWSDYTGVDLCHGPYQNLTGSDGIGDRPYIGDWDFPQFAFDKYPLMGPISVFYAYTWNNVTYYVHTISNSTVSDFYFNPDDKLISFNATGPKDKIGFCRVGIPRGLLWCDPSENWIVKANDTEPYLTVIENGDYTYLYFIYSHDTNVKIWGAHAVPEFPAALLLPIFVIATLIATIFSKKKKSNRRWSKS